MLYDYKQSVPCIYKLIVSHFEEHYENSEMQFDYRMRSGVLTHTNGANVMAALGLLRLPK
jgi:hypothetical protein